MKIILSLFLSFVIIQASGQDISGKWVGKLTQTPGGYSQLYDLELNINQKKTISGESYAYMSNAIYARFGFWGNFDGDSIRLKESKEMLIQDVVPKGWVLCVKNINLAYRKIGNREYLQGGWNGVSKDDERDICLPGSVIMARNKEDLKYFLDSVHSEIPLPTVAAMSPIDFSQKFLNTAIRKGQEIEVKNLDLRLEIRDYLRVDNDTVSIYLNRKPLIKNILLAKRSRIINFRIDPTQPVNEVLIYAENLGTIPPNTSEMFVIDGKKSYRLLIESDLQKSAAIYLRYKP